MYLWCPLNISVSPLPKSVLTPFTLIDVKLDKIRILYRPVCEITGQNYGYRDAKKVDRVYFHVGDQVFGEDPVDGDNEAGCAWKMETEQ